MKTFLIITGKGNRLTAETPGRDYGAQRKRFYALVERNQDLNRAGKPGEIDLVQLWDSATGVRKRAKFLTKADLEARAAARAREAQLIDDAAAQAAPPAQPAAA